MFRESAMSTHFYQGKVSSKSKLRLFLGRIGIVASVMITGVASAQAQLYVTSDRTIDFLVSSSVVVGRTPGGTNVSGVTLSVLSGATIQGGCVSYGNSTVNVSGGELRSGLFGNGTSTIRVTGGSVSNPVAEANSTITLSGGTVTLIAGANDNGTLIVDGSARVPSIGSNNNAVVKVQGGTVAGTVNAVNATYTEVSGGSVDNVRLFDTATALLKGGIIRTATAENNSQLTLQSGTVVSGDITGNSTSHIRMTGGSVSRLLGYNSSVFDVSGGNISDILAFGNSIFNLTGGVIGQDTIRLFDTSVLSIFGNDLSIAINGTGTEFGQAYSEYLIGGTLQNGQSINGVRLRDYAGGNTIGDPYNPGSNSALRFVNAPAIVPEWGTVSLLGTCATFLTMMFRRGVRARHSH